MHMMQLYVIDIHMFLICEGTNIGYLSKNCSYHVMYLSKTHRMVVALLYLRIVYHMIIMYVLWWGSQVGQIRYAVKENNLYLYNYNKD